MEDIVLTPREAGAYCGVNRTTITNWIKRRGLRAQRLPNGYFRIRRQDLDEFLSRFDTYRRSASDASARTVLVAYGPSGLREVLRAAFGERCRVLEAAHPAEVAQVAREARPDVILLEVLPNDQAGRATLRRLQADRLTANIPVVMLTAKPNAAEAVRAVQIGVRDFLLKPFGMNEFVARVENAMRRA